MIKKLTLVLFVLVCVAVLCFSTVYAYTEKLTSPTPAIVTPTLEGTREATIAPTVATIAPTVATAAPVEPTIAPTVAATLVPLPASVTALPASGQHADWRPMMAFGALLFLAISVLSLWHIRVRPNKIARKRMR